MAPINRSHVNVAKPMITKNSSTGEGTLGSPTSSLTVRAVGSKDRHSKVRTAKGLRDRRVRLSAPTAIQFFEVQDRLGFDQPSKALDWLIRNARTAIDELAPLPPVIVSSDRDVDRAMENIAQEINIGQGQDVDEQQETALLDVEQQKTSDFQGGSRATLLARSRTRECMKERTEFDEVPPALSALFTSSSATSEAKQSSIQQLPSANHNPTQQSSDVMSLQPRIIAHSLHLPTYSLYTSSEPNGPLGLHDSPHQLAQFSVPPADQQMVGTSYCISPGGTLQSIFNDVFTDFNNSLLHNVPILELYPLIGLHDGAAALHPAFMASPQVHKLAQQPHEPGRSASSLI